MSPFEIDILLHYYCKPGDHPKVELPQVKDTMVKFVDAGVLRVSQEEGRAFEAVDEPLRMYVEALMNVPFPTLKWTIEQ